MKRIAPQVDNAPEHLAFDEAMLLGAGHSEIGETLRLWQFDDPVVVIGRSSRVSYEVHRNRCNELGIPILRRCSGGAAIVGGPGCLMYSVVLRVDREQGLNKIDVAHRYVMQRIADAVNEQQPEVKLQGTCDLTWNNQKCSGNSLRITRSHLLYHGTILYDADLDLISECLDQAPRQPNYRDGRSHRDFVTNVPVDVERLINQIANNFGVTFQESPDQLPWSEVNRLRKERYENPEWNFRH